MRIAFLILLYYCILLIYSIELTKDQKEKWAKASEPEKYIIATKLSVYYIIELLFDNSEVKSCACYKGAGFIAECPKDTEEKIHRFPPMKSRSCYKKCKENEIRNEQTCFKCNNGKQIFYGENIYGEKDTKKVCGINGEDAEEYHPEEVKAIHCMKNTTRVKDTDICELDCSVLGLKSFGDFCAKDEEDYHQLKIDGILKFYKFCFNNLASLIVQKIFSFKSIGLAESIKNYLILFNHVSKERNISKLIFDLKINIYLKKKFLEQIGKEILIKNTINFLTNKLVDINDKIINEVKKFILLLRGRMINSTKIDKIDPKKDTWKMLFKMYNDLTKNLLDFFDIYEVKGIVDNCHKSKKEEFDYEKCAQSMMNTLGNLDPTGYVGFLNTIHSTIPPVCDIDVNPENSDELLFYGEDPYPLIYTKND